MSHSSLVHGSIQSYEQAMRAANARKNVNDDGTPKERRLDPTTGEMDYSREEVEFAMAMDRYKTQTGRKFPTYHEILSVARSLGYRKMGLNA